MSIIDNISSIYDKAVAEQSGSVWKAIRKLRTNVEAEIRENGGATGDKDVKAALATIKTDQPELSPEAATKQAMDSVIEKRAKDQFVSELSNEAGKGWTMSSLSNMGDIIGKLMDLFTGSWKEKFAVLKSGVLEDVKSIGSAVSRSWSAGGNIQEIFAEQARNSNLTNMLGITDPKEKAQFLADISTDNPVKVAVAPPPAPLTAEQKAAAAQAAKEAATAQAAAAEEAKTDAAIKVAIAEERRNRAVKDAVEKERKVAATAGTTGGTNQVTVPQSAVVPVVHNPPTDRKATSGATGKW